MLVSKSSLRNIITFYLSFSECFSLYNFVNILALLVYSFKESMINAAIEINTFFNFHSKRVFNYKGKPQVSSYHIQVTYCILLLLIIVLFSWFVEFSRHTKQII